MPPKLTLHEEPTPSEAIVKAAKKVVETTDALGRAIKFRKMSALHKQNWAEVMGAERVANNLVATQGLFAYAVTEIDGEAYHPPATYREILAMIDRLDDEGIEAVATAYIEAFGAPGEQVDPDAVKNF